MSAGVDEFSEQFGPDSRWATDLQRARDTGDTETATRLWKRRDKAEKAEDLRQRRAAHYEALSELPEVKAYDAKIAELREAGQETQAAKLEAGRREFIDGAEWRAAAFADKARLQRKIAEDMVIGNRIPEELHVDGDGEVLRLRASLLELAESRDEQAVTQRTETETRLRERLIELALPAVTGGPIVPPKKGLNVEPPQSALGELEAAQAAGDERAIVAAEARISREWAEQQTGARA